MSNIIQYCFEIKNPSNSPLDKEEITRFFQKLYIGPEPKFNSKDELPFLISIISDENIVCLRMLRRGKALLERMNDIHESFSPRDLSLKKLNISFGKPYIRTTLVEQVAWWEGQEIAVGKKKGSKWSSLQHNGPYFTHIMEPYQCLGGIITYDGVEYPLDCPREEEVAMFYAKNYSVISPENKKAKNSKLTLKIQHSKETFSPTSKLISPQNTAPSSKTSTK